MSPSKAEGRTRRFLGPGRKSSKAPRPELAALPGSNFLFGKVSTSCQEAPEVRVLFVINSMGRGGAEVQVRDLAIHLRKRGHAVATVVLMPYEDFEQDLRDAGVEVFSLGMEKGRPQPRAVAELLAISHRFQPDVVHAHLFAAVILTRAAFSVLRAIHRRPVVVSTSHSRRERSLLRYALYRATNSLGDAFTCVSQRGIKEHERMNAARAGTMLHTPNGIDVAAFEDLEALREPTRALLGLENAFVWLALGSFRDESKDYGTMLRAFASAQSGDDRLVIAGEGRLLPEKKQLADSLGIAHLTHFLGLRSDVKALLSAADGYLLSSANEAMPLVLLEASAARLPIVATNVGDVDQVVIEGETGYLVPPSDPRSFATAMHRVRSHTLEERRAFGTAANALVRRRFDFEAVVSRWERLYEHPGEHSP